MKYFGIAASNEGTEANCPNSELVKLDTNHNCIIDPDVDYPYAQQQMGKTTTEACVARLINLYLGIANADENENAYFPGCIPPGQSTLASTASTSSTTTTIIAVPFTTTTTTLSQICIISGCGDICRSQCNYQVSIKACSYQAGLNCVNSCKACTVVTSTTTLPETTNGCPLHSAQSSTNSNVCICDSGYLKSEDGCAKDTSQDIVMMLILGIALVIMIFYTSILMKAKKKWKIKTQYTYFCFL